MARAARLRKETFFKFFKDEKQPKNVLMCFCADIFPGTVTSGDTQAFPTRAETMRIKTVHRSSM